MTISERFWWWLAWRLPRRLAYLAAVRVGAEASTKSVGAVPELTVIEALDWWAKPSP